MNSGAEAGVVEVVEVRVVSKSGWDLLLGPLTSIQLKLMTVSPTPTEFSATHSHWLARNSFIRQSRTVPFTSAESSSRPSRDHRNAVIL